MMGSSAEGQYAYVPATEGWGIGTPQNHAGGGRESSGLQALYFLSDDAVALAGGRFQTFVVENPDFALRVRDQTGGLECPRLLHRPRRAPPHRHGQAIEPKGHLQVAVGLELFNAPAAPESYAVRCMPQSGISG
jgi:hypothetical protein